MRNRRFLPYYFSSIKGVGVLGHAYSSDVGEGGIACVLFCLYTFFGLAIRFS